MTKFLLLVLVLAGCAEKKSDSKEMSADEQAVACSSLTEQLCNTDVCHPILGVNKASKVKEFVGCTAELICGDAISCATPKGYATPRFVLSNTCMPLSYENVQCEDSDMEALDEYSKNANGT